MYLRILVKIIKATWVKTPIILDQYFFVYNEYIQYTVLQESTKNDHIGYSQYTTDGAIVDHTLIQTAVIFDSLSISR